VPSEPIEPYPDLEEGIDINRLKQKPYSNHYFNVETHSILASITPLKQIQSSSDSWVNFILSTSERESEFPSLNENKNLTHNQLIINKKHELPISLTFKYIAGYLRAHLNIDGYKINLDGADQSYVSIFDSTGEEALRD